MIAASALAKQEKAADRHNHAKANAGIRTIELGWGRQRLSAAVPPGGNAEAVLHSLMLEAMKNERGPEMPAAPCAKAETMAAGKPTEMPAPKLSREEQSLVDSNATRANFFGAGSLMLESRFD